MKIISKVINIILVAIILCALFAAVGTAITKEPILLSVIRSNSMYPVWERGDMVLIENLNEEDSIHQGDMIFFKTENGSLASKGWIAHRVVGGNREEGFITQGDANEYTDQESGSGLIQIEEISGRAVTIGDNPIVLPKIGYLSLWMEEHQSNPYLLPLIAIILAVVIAFGELKSDKRKKKKKSGIEMQLIYIIGGLTISIIIGGTMLASGQKFNFIYEVSETNEGVLMGSDVGILKVGEEVSKSLSELSNDGIFPMVGTITSNDEQIIPSHQSLYIAKGEIIDTTYHLTAETPGKYDSSIQVGLFYPFLPKSIIYFLAEKSYWLALIVVSLIPGIPLMVYPLIDTKMRRGLTKMMRKTVRKRFGFLLP